MNNALLLKFRDVVLARKEGNLKNLSSVTRNTPSASEIFDSLSGTFSDTTVKFFFDSEEFEEYDFSVVFYLLKDARNKIPVSPDNGYDYILRLIDVAIGKDGDPAK